MIVTTELPKPKIIARPVNQAVQQKAESLGLSVLLARVIAGRPIPEDMAIENMLSPKLSNLSSPFLMADMKKAADRVSDAVIQGEYIGLETDHDCDGQTSHAVLHHCLLNHFCVPKEKICSYIGHRMLEGYGLSDKVADRILKSDVKPSLVITADNGSCDEPRIQRLKLDGIETIVTDHHHIPSEGIPKSAFACLNPTREDCDYPDPYIAGCMVAWLLMAATRQALIEKDYLPKDAPKLTDTLDYVAVGTVADCVSMAKSENNRIMVSFGLKQIQEGTKPCWRAIQQLVRHKTITTEDLGFVIGPLLNSDGRLGTALGSVSFLLAETEEEASQWVETLQLQNQERKAIQKRITNQGISQVLGSDFKRLYSICLFLEDGHAGVHGISASRIKDLFGRPTVFFAPKLNATETITGSIRGIANFHVKSALSYIDKKQSGLLIAFGGHEGAGGVTLLRKNFEQFKKYFEAAAKEVLSTAELGPVLYTDGFLKANELQMPTFKMLSTLGPYGREFEAPIFQAECVVNDIQFVGDGTHAKLRLKYEQRIVSGIWFNAKKEKSSSMPCEVGDNVLIAFSMMLNQFGGFERIELQINTLKLAP